MTTKKKNEYFDAYIEKVKRYGPRSLYDCYEEPSETKKDIWSSLIKDEFCNYLGVSVIRHTSFIFTVGGIRKDSDNRVWFRVETPGDSGFLKLDDEQVKRVKGVMKIWA